jgi:hypothetical protein
MGDPEWPDALVLGQSQMQKYQAQAELVLINKKI